MTLRTFTPDEVHAAVDELGLASWPMLECPNCSRRRGFLFGEDGTISAVDSCICNGPAGPPQPCEWDDLAARLNGADGPTRQRWAAMLGFDAGYENEQIPGGPGDGRPVVWALCVGTLAADQCWVAYAEDGQEIASHVSSSASWGARDVGPDGFYFDRYIELLDIATGDEVDYRTVPVGGDVPSAVRRAIVSRITADR
jgi:hypothetical protein